MRSDFLPDARDLVPAVIVTVFGGAAHFSLSVVVAAATVAVRKVCKCMQEPLRRQFHDALSLAIRWRGRFL